MSDLRNTPVRKRSELRLESILTAGRAVLADVGRDRLDTAAIAAAAGCSRGTVYRFFIDRVAILDWIQPIHPHGIEQLLNLHRTWNVYSECGHECPPEDPSTWTSTQEQEFHERLTTPAGHNGNTPIDIEEIGWTCTDGISAHACRACCTEDGEYQTEDCANNHVHTADPNDRCPTIQALTQEN
jgi:hypothetical protein